MNDWECRACFEMAKEGFSRLLVADHATTIQATFSLLFFTTRGDELMEELRALWERVKITLPDEVVS